MRLPRVNSERWEERTYTDKTRHGRVSGIEATIATGRKRTLQDRNVLLRLVSFIVVSSDLERGEQQRPVDKL